MEYRKLGNTGLKVTALCLGTMTFGNQADEATAHAILDKAFDAGVTFVDTADVYPLGSTWEQLGRTEEIVGSWLVDKRDKVVLATKVHGAMGPGANDKGLSRKHILQAVDASLRRLHTDYIDLYQAHQVDPDTPVEETLRAFEDLVESGKVRYIGVSNWRAWQVAVANGIAAQRGLVQIQSVQPRYNLLYRMIEEELVPLCQDQGMGLMAYNPLAGGILTGRYKPEQGIEPGSRFGLGGIHSAGRMYQERYWNETVFQVVESYKNWCVEQEREWTPTAVQWVMCQPGITCAILGASRPDQLDASLRAAEAQPLTEEDLAWLDSLWFQLPRRREFR
ncbi:aldo/keto reductase [Alicyclobacillaceae bacterium I2511]|nr:aldo/keto reductase [Alicyclobacillaceae bacterium I2511]